MSRKAIALGGSGKNVAIVDSADFDFLSQWNWSVMAGKYAYRLLHAGHEYAGYVLMHRLIMGNPPGMVDHKDRDGFHNWRSNLRIASKSVNGLNAGPQSNNTSGFRGVDFDKARRKWAARIKVDGVQYYLGRFDSIDAAITARIGAEHRFNLVTPNTLP